MQCGTHAEETLVSKHHRGNTRAAKLTPIQVLDIREAYDTGTTQRELCNRYGVSIGTIGRIVRGETWQSYGGPGEHEGASRQDVDSSMHEAALERMAQMNAPASDSAVIQASLAKLATLGVVPEPPARDGQPVRDPLCNCVGEHDSRTALDCPATTILTPEETNDVQK